MGTLNPNTPLSSIRFDATIRATMMNHPSKDTTGPVASISEPLFLVGCERSGTTLTMVMLNHHPQIAFSNWYYMIEPVGDDGRWPDRDAYLSYLATDRIFQGSGLMIDETMDCPALVQSFLRQKKEQSGKPIMGGK